MVEMHSIELPEVASIPPIPESFLVSCYSDLQIPLLADNKERSLVNNEVEIFKLVKQCYDRHDRLIREVRKRKNETNL